MKLKFGGKRARKTLQSMNSELRFISKKVMGATTFSLSDVNHKILQSAVTNKPITYCFQLYQYSPHSHLLLRDPALLEHMFDPAAVPSASFLEVIRVFQ